MVSSPYPDLELSQVDGRLCIKGDVDLLSAKRILEWLSSFDGQPIELDMSGVTFLDSTGLGTLIQARRLHSGLRIVSASKSVRRIIEITSTTYLLGDADESD